jgi:hypothetical protein
MITTQQFVERETAARKPGAPISVRLANGESYESVFGPIDGTALAREVLDGAVGDDDPFLTLDDAQAGVRRVLEEKIRRTLTPHQADSLAMNVAIEWNRRQEHEDQRNWERWAESRAARGLLV